MFSGTKRSRPNFDQKKDCSPLGDSERFVFVEPMHTKPKGFIDKPFAYHEELNVTIDTLTNEGRGIARINQWIVMVPFVIPGEHVRVRIFKNHKNYSEADLIEIIEPSPKRTQALCPLFGQCGGCQYQHMQYDEQLHWKKRHVQDCFERIAKYPIEVNSVFPSEKIYGYRTKLTPHFEKNKNQSTPIGFLRYGKRRELVDVEACPLASEAINKMLKQERKRVQNNQHLHSGTLLLRESDQGVLTCSTHLGETTLGSYKFKFPAGSFFQNNPLILEAVLKYLENLLHEFPNVHYLLDTYCGVGVFGITLSKFLKMFYGIEIDEKAVELATANAQINGVSNGKFVKGTAETIFQTAPLEAEKTLVLLDPPRTGCSEVFLEQMLKFQPQCIVYISCAPDTQARDLRQLLNCSPHYHVHSLQPFDMFPQTRHIETVLTLIRQPR